jgi:monoamine oxidase
MQFDIIIVGAGASGLMAMRELTRAGYRVCLLEAGAVPGGRCTTIMEPGFDHPVEAGAEFVHGKAKKTLKLLKKGNIRASEVTGHYIPISKGVWLEAYDMEEYYKRFIKAVKKSGEDMTLRSLLDRYFSEPGDERGRKMIEQFAEGFSLADPERISSYALRNDWRSQQETQLRVDGGYTALINFLVEDGMGKGGNMHMRSRVHLIEHGLRSVTAHTTDGRQYKAERIIVTVPLAVLQAGNIRFDPAIPEQENAWNQLAVGSVIKFLFQFREPFWLDKDPKAAFFLSDEFVPTWWTQPPPASNILTGWLGGPPAAAATAFPGETLYEKALHSLASIFQRDMEGIRQLLTHHKINCWDVQPFIKGGYSYNTLASPEAKRVLAQPVQHTLYFAGEAMYAGKMQGTVEAALVSGEETAQAIILEAENT